jgi:DNA-directed RNA polymerase subunit H (RpoH/RPB5)
LPEKTSNESIPVHILLDAKEAKEVLSKLQLKHENLPKILSTDPQAVSIGAKPGDVIKVKRHDYGSEYLYYRSVIEG